MVNKINIGKFVAPSDSILVTRAKKISVRDIQSPRVKEDIQAMLSVAFGEQKNANVPLLVGLAAPQIGISKRIILVDLSADGKGKLGDLHVFINPEIIWKSAEEAEWYEGCFSTDCVCGVVARSTHIKVRAYTREGELSEDEYHDFVARIFQHEIDHLDGIEFVRHIQDDNKLHWVEGDEFPAYRNNQAWRNWPHKCPRERWEKIKGIQP